MSLPLEKGRPTKHRLTLALTHTQGEEGRGDFSGSCYTQLASPRLRGDSVCHEDRGKIWSAICFNNSLFLTS